MSSYSNWRGRDYNDDYHPPAPPSSREILERRTLVAPPALELLGQHRDQPDQWNSMNLTRGRLLVRAWAGIGEPQPPLPKNKQGVEGRLGLLAQRLYPKETVRWKINNETEDALRRAADTYYTGRWMDFGLLDRLLLEDIEDNPEVIARAAISDMANLLLQASKDQDPETLRLIRKWGQEDSVERRNRLVELHPEDLEPGGDNAPSVLYSLAWDQVRSRSENTGLPVPVLDVLAVTSKAVKWLNTATLQIDSNSFTFMELDRPPVPEFASDPAIVEP